MKGKYRIIIYNKRIRYDFEIKRNITIIRGDSATGKTALVNMVREYDQAGADSGIELQCSKKCVVLEGKNWKTQMASIQDSMVFIDETSDFISSKEFATEIQKTNNYYIIVTRESLSALPYSVNEIYGIKNSGKYGSLKQTYNEFFQLYGQDNFLYDVKPEVILTEDSNSGFQFFENLCREQQIACVSANGKSNIFSCLTSQKGEKVLVIADGGAFGAEMDKLMKLLETRQDIVLYLPESFEWLILKSGVLQDKEIVEILHTPYDYLESSEYLSWERYFTSLLVEKTQRTYLQYNKRVLNKVYTQPEIVTKVLKTIKKINFDGKNSVSIG